ncbi:MAG: hypothetical protein Kow0081_5120 [Candidatus Dojkabacteria bacterium]
MHRKEEVLEDLLKTDLGISLFVPKDFNTDKYGTFTREVKRRGTQIEIAIRKAKDAANKYGYDLAIASEGSFGPDPRVPFLNLNYEVVVLVDLKNGLEVVGEYFTNDTNFSGRYISAVDKAEEYVKKLGFPKSGVILRKSKDFPFFIYKNIKTFSELKEVFRKLSAIPFSRKVFIEADMRADRNPKRMKAIEKAGKNLVEKVLKGNV